MKQEPVIQFEHFGFKYDAQIEPTLYDINLSIYPGEKILIAGPSGCGKSTLANCINGLIPFSYYGESTGSIRLNGKETSDLSLFEISKTVGTVLQDSDAQFVGLTVAEDIAFVLENDCVPHSEMLERVAEVAATVGVPSSLSHAPHELSGGQKQRVSLAGVMINDVKVLLFDEPLANLDPATGKKAIELIDDIHKQTGAAVIIIEHRIEDVLHRDVDRIILVNDGRIIADLHPNEILCGDALKNAGLREPLYITAMKYAGVKIVPDMLPQHIEDIVLSAETKKLVSDWFEKTPAAEQSEKGPAIFQAEHIRFSYSKGHEVIHDVSFTVHRGEIMCIIGQNGAGKSTISKLICGFETPQEGTMLLEGTDIAPLTIKERAEHIGYVMQDPNQMISKTMIREEVGLALELDGLPREEIDRKVEETLRVCGLHPFRNWPISALSFGQKKRVTVASILSMNPEIVILDEPTAGQDFKHYTEIMEFLLELNRQGVTIIMITHDMHLMLEYAPRAVVFTDGKILCDDSPANILTNPDLVEAASLKETSLFTLAVRCGISEPSQFVQRFIDYDRRVRER
ncbi:MAG: ABC transporter ATP-binding protein [Clostridia bacterium]|nr:ABC transporter ATP-binding protein [Clostridia bacterium]MCR5073722.1 ABC transporter ATP-binding protein [Clostridiales bacterium]